MKNKSNSELLKIITELKDDYQQEAVEVAEQELKSRNLTKEELNDTKIELEKENEIIKEKANTELEGYWKVLAFIFPGIINIYVALLFKGKGYDNKQKGLVKWTVFGFLFYFGIIILALTLGQIPISPDFTPKTSICDCDEIIYDDNETFYCNNELFSGSCKSFYSNGNIKSEAHFKNGKLNGELINYFENSKISDITKYEYGNAKYSVSFYETGDTLSFGNIKNNERNGKWIEKFRNGKIKTIVYFDNGLMVDTSYDYYFNGQLKLKSYWINNMANGTWFSYDSLTGEILGIQEYKNDTLIK